MRERWADSRVAFRSLVWVLSLGLAWTFATAHALTELEEENSLSTSFETPHTKWAQPYAQGKLRVLFFMNIGYCGTVPREVVELRQRFDLDAEAVFWANIIDSPKYHWHGDAAGLTRMEQLVAQPWDCFVFFAFPVEQVPVQEQYRLLQAVTVAWQYAASARKLKLEASLRRLDGEQVALSAPLAVGSDGSVTLALPRLRAGQYFVDVRARSKAGSAASSTSWCRTCRAVRWGPTASRA